MIPEEFDGRTLRRLRRAADMTQAEAGNRAGLTQTQISKIERLNQYIKSWRIAERYRRIFQIEDNER